MKIVSSIGKRLKNHKFLNSEIMMISMLIVLAKGEKRRL
ncbi:hypothetical protein D082_01830 [Synechocystis sp. PCC 6714]|nr:hypothetical protein D082_01830 [Synechocystis sp. PCC 6714]